MALQDHELTPRERVNRAFAHHAPDRVPVDFLATNEVWDKLIAHFAIDTGSIGPSNDYFDVVREEVLRKLAIDCRVLSYDMFCHPPESALHPGATVEWWDVLSRSTPNRMWRQRLPNGDMYDVFGRHSRIVTHGTGAYEESASYPLASAHSVKDLDDFTWPDPDWWDFSPVPDILAALDSHTEYHVRFRIGSVFEVAWQLRGMEQFMIDLVMQPEIPQAIMTRLTDVYEAITRRVLAIAGERLDMMYFYDDVASQRSLLMSEQMWQALIKPHHKHILDACRDYAMPVMYHSDGAIYDLIPQLMDLGVSVLNPIQPDAAGMDLHRLKQQFGHELSFHGGIDIIKTLPQGTPEDVQQEVRDRINVLGEDGGYVLASSHHIQSDTPIENVLAMYDLSLREI